MISHHTISSDCQFNVKLRDSMTQNSFLFPDSLQRKNITMVTGCIPMNYSKECKIIDDPIVGKSSMNNSFNIGELHVEYFNTD